VKGSDKWALIDGVEVSRALDLVDHIKAMADGRQPDYLVINHMEPDHSGAIRILCNEFPQLTIVGNAQTLSMIKGFYGIADRTLAVRDGDTLDLGGRTLQFVLTPMVHWPETMMTYLVEEKTLFSGDAFGCFGALRGAVVDTDMDTTSHYPEMERYYACIVGKYGVPVQRALKKLDGVPIEMICPTHGPVWQDEIKRVIAIYNRLSLYEAEDGVTIVYGSMYGNTAAAAEAVAARLAANGIRKIAIHDASHSDLSYILADIFRYRGLVIASPTYSGTLFPPIETVMNALRTREICNRVVGVVGSCTWAQQATKSIQAYLDTMKMELIDEPVAFKHAATAETVAQCEAVADKLTEALRR
jgi:flavorubredoxin